MHAGPFLNSFVLLFGIAVAVIALSHRLAIPPLLGYLFTGALVGPLGFGWISDTSQIDVLAELGIVFLLFAIGVEMPVERLRQLGRYLMLGGSVQSATTGLAAGLIAMAFGSSAAVAVVIGASVALSSTAVLFRLYHQRRELDTLHARFATGVLIFQDLLFVPLLLLVPILAGQVPGSAFSIGMRFGGGLLAIGLAVLAGRFIVPRLLALIAGVQSLEIMTVIGLFACLGCALATDAIGFSMALGGFLAGIVLAESDFRYQIAAGTGPFRDVLSSFFFITIGMLLDLSFVGRNLHILLALSLAVMVGKALFAGVAARLMGFPFRTVALAAVGLSQLGEFSLVLLQRSHHPELIGDWLYQMMVAVTIVTMLATPLVIAGATRWFRHASAATPSRKRTESLTGKVVVFGYGINGQHLARILGEGGIDHVIVDANPKNVRAAQEAGITSLFGDCSSPAIQEEAGVPTARIAVFAVPDLQATLEGVSVARKLNPKLFIVVRARSVHATEALARIGADAIINEDYEASIEIVMRVLEELRLPTNVIRTQARLLRDDAYDWLRRPKDKVRVVSDAVAMALSAGTGETYLLAPDHYAVGKNLREIRLRERSGATVIAVMRADRALPNPPPDLVLEAGDILVLIGSHAEVERAFEALRESG